MGPQGSRRARPIVGPGMAQRHLPAHWDPEALYQPTGVSEEQLCVMSRAAPGPPGAISGPCNAVLSTSQIQNQLYNRAARLGRYIRSQSQPTSLVCRAFHLNLRSDTVLGNQIGKAGSLPAKRPGAAGVDCLSPRSAQAGPDKERQIMAGANLSTACALRRRSSTNMISTVGRATPAGRPREKSPIWILQFGH